LDKNNTNWSETVADAGILKEKLIRGYVVVPPVGFRSTTLNQRSFATDAEGFLAFQCQNENRNFAQF